MDDLDLRRERAAHNQSLFREVNERIAALSRRLGEDYANAYICECRQSDCLEMLELSQDDYESLRRQGSRFFVLPGHEDDAVEDVVEASERYLIVEKVGVGSVIAEAMNPRKTASVS